MATTSETTSFFDEFDDVIGAAALDAAPDLHVDDATPLVPAAPAAAAPIDPVAAALHDATVVVNPVEEASAVERKPLLEIRGFYITGGEGIYDGATREGEEPRENYFVDVQDYESGEIKRVWGVALRDVIADAQRNINLQPGSRVHLIQQGKREVISDRINERNEMEVTRSHANAWICAADRGPLPSQLAHLMAGINVDQMLDRIALRHDMGLDDGRLPAWKQEQLRLLKAIGDDPATIKGWLARQTSLSAEEERRLIERGVELDGYGDADPARKQHEIDSRLAALREMHGDNRYNYLMETAKPHLIETNRNRDAKIRSDVGAAIDQYVSMALPDAKPDAPESKAIRSAMAQSVDGLTLTQQLDYVARRREMLLENLTAKMTAAKDAPAAELDRFAVIDATKLSTEEYQQRLEEKLALAKTPQERVRMVEDEVKARKLDTKNATELLKPVEELYQYIAGSRDVDMTAYYLSRAIGYLVRSIATAGAKLMPSNDGFFKELGGVGAWRRKGCESGLADLQQALADAKAAPVYQAFEKDPQVLAACAGREPAALLATDPDFGRSDVAMEHLDAQENAPAPAPRSRPSIKGLWAGVHDAAHAMAERVSHLKPEHLIKRDGKVDEAWLASMQKGLGDFGKQIKETLMPEKIREQIQEMMASILNTIRMLMDMAKGVLVQRTTPVAETKAATAEMGR